MSKRVLVAGVNGFVGHHLARELAETGHTVIGTGIDKALDPTLAPYVKTFLRCDLTDREAVSTLPLDEVDAVINLAGLAQVGASFDPGQAERYTHINVAVHTTILERLRQLDNKAVRVIAVSTGAVYDNTQKMPINEDGLLITEGSPYAHSKLAMERALAEYQGLGFDVVVVRPFNHIGPGQLGGFLVPDLIEKLRHLGADNVLSIGRLDTKRDYTDVRDVARAYRLLATSDELAHSLYNVCSGASHSGQEILDVLTGSMDISGLRIEVDKSRIRPNDPADVRGEASRLQTDTGWKPQIAFEQTLRDCLS